MFFTTPSQHIDQGGSGTIGDILKFLLFNSGSRKLRVHAPATVTVESCPSLVMFGVMNIHWGNWLFFRSSWNKVKFLICASLSGFCATESYNTAGLCLRTYMFAPVFWLR